MTGNASNPQPISQIELKSVYLENTRNRFKSEVNRLTSGAMGSMLSEQPDAQSLSFLFSYLYIFHWLQHNVPKSLQPELLSSFRKGRQAFLMELLLQSDNGDQFVELYIQYWLDASSDETPPQRLQLFQLLESSDNDPQRLIAHVSNIWSELNLFSESYKAAYNRLAQEEKQRYRGMLGREDQERLSLIDSLPEASVTSPQFAKLGIIPAMGCPQTCRHCMFIFRPLMKDTPDPTQLIQEIDNLTDSILFTGGDLTNHLDHFYGAIKTMQHVTTFAILLNGDFANDRDTTRQVIESMARAVRTRPVHWPKARVVLQISFDEFHQEVVLNKQSQFEERISIQKIANIVEQAPRFKEIQLCLLHKQHSLNFSMEIFSKGVFGRLTKELSKRGHKIEVISSAPSSRLKHNPASFQQPAPVLKDASFVLSRFPKSPVLLTSSTIDAFGRAKLIDVSESVRENRLLQQVLSGDSSHGETFDKDLMFWFNGWATLFSAVHICLGNVFEEGMEKVLQRQQKDPLTAALHRFDLRLLDYYREKADDLDTIIADSTGPHHLFHTITERPAIRLHMTERLLNRI